MKKSGFTLIETLISIVILGIILSSVMSAYAFSFRLFKSCDTKTYIQMYSKVIFSEFKNKNTYEIKNIYDNAVKNSSGLTGDFINFDDINELKIELNKLSFGSEAESGSLEECRSKNFTKHFTTFLGVFKSNTYCTDYDSYTLVIRILDNHSSALSGVEYEKDFVVSY